MPLSVGPNGRLLQGYLLSCCCLSRTDVGARSLRRYIGLTLLGPKGTHSSQKAVLRDCRVQGRGVANLLLRHLVADRARQAATWRNDGPLFAPTQLFDRQPGSREVGRSRPPASQCTLMFPFSFYPKNKILPLSPLFLPSSGESHTPRDLGGRRKAVFFFFSLAYRCGGY